MPFARRVFHWAGIYGLVVLLPQFFMESRIGQDFPPPITHPENFYGFLGVAAAWQVAFLFIARDPVRYRIFMLAAILEKLAFGVAVIALYVADRTSPMVLVFGCLDMVLAGLFVLAYRKTAGQGSIE